MGVAITSRAIDQFTTIQFLATVPFIIVQRQRSSLGLDAANLGRYYWVGFSRERVTNPEGAQFLWM